jgi:transposase
LPKGLDLDNVDIYFQDEARIGQQGSTTRIWARKGTRPRVVRQKQFISANIFGAVCPANDSGFALILPHKDTSTMKLFLREFSKTIAEGRHALVITDRASWHRTSKLKLPHNVSLLFLPPYSPELNPIEQVWRQLRHNKLSNRCFKTYMDIVNTLVDAWNSFVNTFGAIKKLCSRSWATLAA